MAGSKIIGLGRSAGELVVTNADLEKIVDTQDEWIRSKTGIRSRYFAGKKSNADMAAEAAAAAVKSAGIDPADIGLCIVATFTPDIFTPATACSVCERLGLSENVTAFDINGACAGFIFGCNIADSLLAAGRAGKYALIIGSEKISPLMDMGDRATCVLFGDGAGAAVLEYDEAAEFGFYGGCVPDSQVLRCNREPAKIEMAGQEVYRFAVSKVPECINALLDKAGKTACDVDYFVCHQANERIIDAASRRICKIEEERNRKFFKNLYEYGNTSAASIPIALCEMYEQGLLGALDSGAESGSVSGEKTSLAAGEEARKLQESSLQSGDGKGYSLVCTGFGAGLTYGSMWIEAHIEGRK